jgi:glucose/arabinose dehydrogenase
MNHRALSLQLLLVVCASGLGLASTPHTAHGQLSLELVISGSDGLEDPIFVTGSGATGDNRLFVASRDGRIEVWLGDRFAASPYLDLSTAARSAPDSVDPEGEGGLLGVAFSPDFANDGFFYVYYTAGDPSVSNDLESRVSRFQALGDPLVSNLANPAETILAPFPLAQPRTNHNGGNLDIFDDYLYIALGDGGQNRNLAQDDSTLFGKLIRLDLMQDPPTAEVVGKGLRNPFRFSIDSMTGDIYIGDVGGSLAEEISIVADADLVGVPIGNAAPLNFGWPIEEGFVCLGPVFPADPPCGDPSLIPPVFDYDHSNNRFAVVGGVVYRGADASLQGQYFFGDWLAADFWSLEWNSTQGLLGEAVSENTLFAPLNQVVAFGTDSSGEVYVVDPGGGIYRVVPEPGMLLSSVSSLGMVWLLIFFRRRKIGVR